MAGSSRSAGAGSAGARSPGDAVARPRARLPARAGLLRLGLPALGVALTAAAYLFLWPSGSPKLYSIFPAIAGLRVPACEPSRLLVLKAPPMRGDDVTEVQEALRRCGLYDGPVDGIFGEETAGAVTVFRMEHHLSRAPRVDTAFWRAVQAQWLTSQPGGSAIPASDTPGPPEGDLLIVINIEKARLTLYAGGYPYKSYPVAVGKPSTPSAVGQWRVRNKGINVGPPFGTRWMGLSVPWGIYGVHGTNNPGSIGSAVSGGCIRMFNWNVEELYQWVDIGTPVHIISPNWTASVRPSLPEGSVGLSVVFLQWQMQRLNWHPGEADGRLGKRTVEIVRDLESFYGLKVDGLADTEVLCLLDLDR